MNIPVLALGLGIGTLLLAVSMRVPGVADWHDAQRLWLGVLLLASACAAAGPAAHRTALLAAAARWGRATGTAILAALALGLVSAAGSGFVRLALLEVSTFALLALLAVTVMVVRDRQPARFDRWMLGAIALAAACTVVPFLVAWTAAVTSSAGYVAAEIWQQGFSNPRFLGQFQTLTLPLIAAACLASWLRGYRRAAAWAVLLGCWLLALFTATRATWYALLPAVVMVGLVMPRSVGRLLVPAGATLLIGVALGWLMFDVLPARLAAAETGGVDAFAARVANPWDLRLRDVLWWRALEVIREAPLLGAGPMGLALDASPVAAHPHSAPLQLAAEWGLPAAAAFAAAAVLGTMRLLRGIRRGSVKAVAAGGPQRDQQALATALLIALCAAAIHAQVDGLLVMPVAQGLLALLVGWAGSLHLEPAQPEPSRASRASPALAVVSLALAGALLAGLLPELPRLKVRSEAREIACPEMLWRPRVWVDGSYWDEAGPARRFTPLPPPPGCRPGTSVGAIPR
jgi:O-antigen ligase